MKSTTALGKRYGHLIVLEIIRVKGKNPKARTKCDCGNIAIKSLSNMYRGKTISCGCYRKRRLEFSEVDAVKAVMRQYMNSAQKRRLDFLLDYETFRLLVHSNCSYCGDPPVHRSRYKKFAFNGIDRLDNNVGYLPENCVSCCASCNMFKKDMDVSEFLGRISKIQKFRETQGISQ